MAKLTFVQKLVSPYLGLPVMDAIDVISQIFHPDCHGHFHWSAGGEFCSGSQGCQSCIFLAKDSSSSAYKQRKIMGTNWHKWVPIKITFHIQVSLNMLPRL